MKYFALDKQEYTFNQSIFDMALTVRYQNDDNSTKQDLIQNSLHRYIEVIFAQEILEYFYVDGK